MSYSTQALLSSDADFRQRLASCAATQGIENPLSWAETNSWMIAAAPGFDGAYESAVLSGLSRPGDRADVITDGQILSAVQAFLMKK